MMLDHHGHRMVNRTHGLRATYNDGCRCEPCRDADRAYKRKRFNQLSPSEVRDNEIAKLFDTIAEIVTDRWAEWRTRAACRDTDVNMFYAQRGANQVVTEAKRLCATCPVADECQRYARSRGERIGIWAGQSMNRHMNADRPRERCRVCGQTFNAVGTQRLCSETCRIESRRASGRRAHRRKSRSR